MISRNKDTALQDKRRCFIFYLGELGLSSVANSLKKKKKKKKVSSAGPSEVALFPKVIITNNKRLFGLSQF